MSARQLASLLPVGLPATIAGRYHVVCPLGKGGMAQVLRVTDGSAGRPLALKLLAGDASAALKALFELEYQTLASMQHPCVVRVFEFGRAAEGAFYTMELLEGEDLSQLAPVTWREACGYLRDAALALTLLHARGLVHRDVSPRNLWRCVDGRVKLIDFGALSPFGRVEHVIGTPPCVAPEVLRAREVDQRTDLYALGAVAYFLLTRMHAYPARDLSELSALWEEAVAPPSAHVAELARVDLEPVPPELDALVLALLSASPRERPSTGAEVIDRIALLLGASGRGSHGQRELVGAHLTSAAYVGEQRARTRLKRLLTLALSGRGQSCVIHGEAGSGRSRALHELAVEAQLRAGAVLHVRAQAVASRPLGLASALALQLLDGLPEVARAAARPHAAVLAHLSADVQARFAVDDALSLESSNELRLAAARAWCDWLVSVSRTHPLIVLVDDVDHADESSLTALLSLVDRARGSPLLLVLTAATPAPEATRPILEALYARARSLALTPLAQADVAALLHSVFGAADNLPRLSAHAFRVTRGNPGHVLELCAQLVARDVISFSEGSWLLPQELPAALSSASREQTLLARLELLDAPARQLARVLSIHDALPRALVDALATPELGASLAPLGALLAAGVCVADGDAIVFAHAPVRQALLAELARDPEQKRLVHRVLGRFLLARASDTLERFEAGAHLVDGGDPAGTAIVSEAGQQLALKEPDNGRLVIEEVERVCATLRAAGCSDAQLAPLLALLGLAGYTVHPRYAADYGELAVSTLAELVGLPRARKLRAYFGRRLGLVVALLIGAIRLARRRKEPGAVSHPQAVALLFSMVPALAGTAALVLDPERAHRYASVLEPFTALGKKHAASFMYELCITMADTVRDRTATRARWLALLARLESTPLKGVTESIRNRLMHAILHALGIIEALRDGDAALRLADRSEQLGLVLADLGAEQVRAAYYANRGDFAQFEYHRARAEQLAIQLGTSWQVEMWAPPSQTYSAFRAHDAMALKRVAAHLQRVRQQVPALGRFARRARGAYLIRRGRYAEALSWLEDVLTEPPRGYPDWSSSIGMLAHAHNQLGEHQRAREICAFARAHSTSEDMTAGGAALFIQREDALAQAALGDPEGAHERLRAMLVAGAQSGSPLTMGELHDAALTVALLRGDEASARAHFEEMERCFVSTGAASLAQYCASRRFWVRPGQGGAAAAHAGGISEELASQVSGATVERMLAGGGLTFAQRARRALQILAERTGASDGSLYMLDDDGSLRMIASLAEAQVEPELLAWLRRSVERELEDDATQILGDAQALSEPDSALRQHGELHHRGIVLFGQRGPVGVALVSRQAQSPEVCPPEIVTAVTKSLSHALSQEGLRQHTTVPRA